MTLTTIDDLGRTLARAQLDADEVRARRLAAKLRDDVTDLQYLEEVWPWLVTLRTPGSRQRWVQRDSRRRVLTSEDLDAMGWKGVPRPAPADVTVLDVLAGVVDVGRRCAVEMLRALPHLRWEVWCPTVPATRDARPWLHLAARLLPQAHTATVDDLDPIVEWVEARLGSLPADAARLMGDIRDGQDLAGICPWCHGLTARGVGEPTMRIHYPSGTVHAQPFDPDSRKSAGDGQGALIVCHGINCTPPSHACGTRWHGHPAWNMREWEWLAKQLGTPGGTR